MIAARLIAWPPNGTLAALATPVVTSSGPSLGVNPNERNTAMPETFCDAIVTTNSGMPRPSILPMTKCGAVNVSCGHVGLKSPTDDGWRARVAAVALDNRTLFAQHPWVASVSTSRPVLGPGLMAKYDYELSAFEGLGLDEVTMDAALTFVLGFVETCARAAADARAARYESALSDGEWWAANQPLLERVFDAERYPLAARVGAAAGAAHDGAYSPAHAYEFGLARVIDGLATLIEH